MPEYADGLGLAHVPVRDFALANVLPSRLEG